MNKEKIQERIDEIHERSASIGDSIAATTYRQMLQNELQRLEEYLKYSNNAPRPNINTQLD